MSNYSQVTAFTPKDSLSTGNPAKVIKGSDFDAEFAAISTAIISKADAVDLSNVDNTSDLNKPISTTTQTALDAKVTGPASSTDNTIPRFDGTTGKLLQGSGVVVDDSNNVGIGGTPFQKLHVYGNMRLDPGVGTALLQAIHTGTAYRDLHIDAAGTYHINGAFGYGAGAGGTVTQVTSKSTDVTLNKPSGRITMHNAALASGAFVAFYCYNTFFSANDTVIAVVSGATPSAENYSIRAAFFSGAIRFVVQNTTGGSLSEAVQIQFTIIKGSTT